MRLAVTCQLADERAAANPDDLTAARYAEALADLFYDALDLPDGHPLFERWQEHQWLPIGRVDEIEPAG
ncbi:hypothetical protein G3I74_13915 [Wenzhouxiangella sp. C33]|uniref:Uncharacterized protein n=2 Tax=Wenzhouxiangella limi TaxID=2707351 RepID=A0A845VA90_9GAMM|nr:hypothetical protein [Wenzhouxiangella limi]